MKAIAFVMCIAMLACGFVSSPSSAECVNYGDYLHWENHLWLPFEAHGVVVSGSYAYLTKMGGESGLAVVDITNPEDPQIIGGVDTPGNTWGITLSGHLAYVTEGESPGSDWSGVRVIDITNPGSLRIVGSVELPAGGYYLAAAGDYVYVADGVSGLQIIDVRNPEMPRVVGSVPIPGSEARQNGYGFSGYAFGVAVSGTHAYVTSQRGLQVIDVSNPQAPRIVGMVVGIDACGVAVSGDFAYVGDRDGLKVVDISIPSDPRIVGATETGDYVMSVILSGQFAYIGDYWTGFHVVDVTDPRDPGELGQVQGGVAYGVAILGPYVYIANEATFSVIHMPSPMSVQVIGGVVTPIYTQDVAVSGDYAYLSSSYGLSVVDVSNPRNPRVAGGVATPSLATGLAVSGGFACVSLWGSFVVIDIADPSDPRIVGSMVIPYEVGQVAISGTYAFLAAGDFKVIDFSDPQHPRTVASVHTSSAVDVAVDGIYAYVADGHPGLEVFDVSDPTNPQLIAALDVPNSSRIALLEDNAYLISNWGEVELKIVNIAYPWNPWIEGSRPFRLSLTGVAAMGSHVYVGSLSSRIYALESNPESLQLIGTADVPGMVNNIVEADGYIYVADYDHGLQIVPLQCEAAEVAGPTDARSVLRLSAIPNPALRRTSIRLVIPSAGPVCVAIHDVAGRLVRSLQDGTMSVGVHDLLWDGRDDAGREIAAGIYLARVATSEGTRSGRVVILR